MFLLFFGWLSLFFHSFFLDFFFFILLLKYTFLHAHGFYTTILLHVLLSFPPRVCVSIVSLNSIARAHTHIPIIMTGFLFALLNQCFNLSHSKFYLETSSSSSCLYDHDHARTHSRTRDARRV